MPRSLQISRSRASQAAYFARSKLARRPLSTSEPSAGAALFG